LLKQQIFNLLCCSEGFGQTTISDVVLKKTIGMIGNGFDLKDNNRKLINALSSYLKVIYYDEDDKSMEDISNEIKKTFIDGAWIKKYGKLNTETGHQTGSQFLKSLNGERLGNRWFWLPSLWIET